MDLNLPGGDEALQKVLQHHAWAIYSQSALVLASVALNIALISLIFSRQGFGLVARPGAAPWSFTRGIETMARYFFIYFGVMVLVLLLKQEFEPILNRIGFDDLHLMVFGTGLIQVLSLGVVWFFARAQKQNSGAPLGAFWTGSSPGRALLGIGVFVLVIFPVGMTMLLTKLVFDSLGLPFDSQPLVEQLSQTNATWFVVALSIFAVIVAPVVEEVFFRGILYPTLRLKWGIAPAVIVSSLIFAAMHFHLPTFLPLFVLAVFLSLAFEFTGSLPACIIAHSLFNSLSIIAIWLLRSVR